MNLDVNHLVTLDGIVMNEMLKPREKDSKALEYINQIQVPHNTQGLRNQYVKYYFQAKRDYITMQSLGKLDIFKQDI